MTSAPKSDMTVAAAGAAMKLPQSITFRPSNKSPISLLPCSHQEPVWLTRLHRRLLVGSNRFQRPDDRKLLGVALAFQLFRRARGEGCFRLRDDLVLCRLVQIARRHVLPGLVETRAELFEERREAAGTTAEMERTERA